MKRTHSDDGVTLIFALIFMTVISLIVAGLASFATTELRAGTVVTQNRDLLYAADAAVQGAIHNLRYRPDVGIAANDCDYTPPSGTNGISGITVRCEVLSGSGGADALSTPLNAVLTLASGVSNASEGLLITGGGSSDLTVSGAVFSNTLVKWSTRTFNIKNGDLTDRFADQTSGTVDQCKTVSLNAGTYTGSRHCGLPSTVTDPRGDDPRGEFPPPAVPGTTGVIACGPGNKTVQLTPGTYTTAPVAPGACSGAPWWLKPGLYYWNFNSALTVRNDVVAGAPLNWDPTLSSASIPDDDLPACDEAQDGAEIVFGGSTRLVFDNEKIRFEVCPKTTSTGQKVALYQAPSDAGGGLAVPTGCIVAKPYSKADGSTCPLVFIAPHINKPAIVLHGTLYAPSATVDVHVHNLNDYSIFGRGVVVRNLLVDISSSATLADLIRVDSQPGRGPRKVILRALRGGRTIVSTQATFDDGPYGGAAGSTVTIDKWSATP